MQFKVLLSETGHPFTGKCESGPIYHLLEGKCAKVGHFYLSVGICANGYPFAHIPTNK